jgi:DNA-binding CsgD family transcriptional regulator
MAAGHVRDQFTGLLHRGAGVREFAHGASRILERAIGFDGVCTLTFDPATLLPTGETVENGLPGPVMPVMTEIEIRGEDFNAWRTLAQADRHVATLMDATDGDLDRSERHRTLRGPHGFGDELRALLADDSGPWGALTLHREAGSRPFTPEEVALVESSARYLAEGLRRALLLSALGQGPRDEAAGLLVLAPDNAITLIDATAQHWLEELRGTGASGLPPAVSAVAARARGLALDPTGPIARARVHTPNGAWLLVRGTTLGADQTAVIIEAAHAHELAPLIADAYGLTERERAVTALVAQGCSTDQIAARLFLSPYTVQDHLKAIFEKAGVGSRGELVARLFFAHHAPVLEHA